MFTKYMKSLTKQDCPVVLSITAETAASETTAVIQRNDVRSSVSNEASDIYLRARKIYFRARRHRPVRAASIF